MGLGPEIERLAIDCGRRHEASRQRVVRQYFQGAAGFENNRRALLIGEIQPSIGIDRRSRVFAAHPFRPDNLSGGGIGAGDKALIGRHVNQSVHHDRRGVFGNMSIKFPHHMSVGHVTRAVRPDGPEFLFVEACHEVKQPSVKDGSRRTGPVAVLHFPDFFSSARVITVGRLGTRAEQLGFAADHPDQRGAVSLAPVAIPDHLSSFVFIVPDDRPVRLPNGLAGFLVEGGQVLQVRAIEGQDQQILKEDRA